jgi:hypothetical protein
MQQWTMIRTVLTLLLLAAASLRADGPVYVALWFDTEDYIEPAADDAALRIARDLTGLGVRATFKIVGEKARVLEQRGRWDVVRALALHDIGYHSNFHSVQPTPALYLRDLGYVEGAAEFERREGAGALDLARIFGVRPSCYGQPGNSWAPQANAALRRMGIPVYLDEGSQVGLNDQPFWYGGLLHVYNMGRFQLRAPLRRTCGAGRRRDQHLLSSDRIRHDGVLGRHEFCQGGQPRAHSVAPSAAADRS